MSEHFDVAIVGGGPSGATTAVLLKTYNPGLTVCILEREVFPRDHIGESLLPPVGKILEEMGCWDAVEAANFPIKIGATFKWGKRPELWDFEFLASETFLEEPRPAKFEGQRLRTAFQVDRSLYDTILLNRAAELGCAVKQNTKVSKVEVEGDCVTALNLEGGDFISARHYVDASGNSGVLRRALDVPCEYPTTLRNIAIYDYWQNAEWAVKIGVGGTRIQVLSVGFGWIWFIPLGPTRTSIGLIVPAEYLKKCGKSPSQLYSEALAAEPILEKLLASATSEGKLQTTRDWSFLAERHAGSNWFLVGECAGFADPILSAGVTIAALSAQQAAYTILELDRGTKDSAWLKSSFSDRQRDRIRTHIRFADYWYSANEQFDQLKGFTQNLAADIGLDLTPEGAWDWIARGGFIDEELSHGTGGFTLASIRAMNLKLGEFQVDSAFDRFNEFHLDLSGASWKDRARYQSGKVLLSQSYTRGGKVLPIDGPYEFLVDVLQRASQLDEILEALRHIFERQFPDPNTRESAFNIALQTLDAMVSDGWVTGSYDPWRPLHPQNYSDRPVRWQSERAPSESPSGGT